MEPQATRFTGFLESPRNPPRNVPPNIGTNQ